MLERVSCKYLANQPDTAFEFGFDFYKFPVNFLLNRALYKGRTYDFLITVLNTWS